MADEAKREGHHFGALAQSPRARLRKAIAWLLGACVLLGAGFIGLRAAPARVVALDLGAWPPALASPSDAAASEPLPAALYAANVGIDVGGASAAAPTATVAEASEPSDGGTLADGGDAGVRLDLNRATEADLERLPGIGPKRAGAILALRSRLGRFHRIEELLRVRGLGKTMLKRLRPLVEID